MMAVGFLGLLLQGAVYLSLGAFISTTTRNQIIASSVTFAVFLILYVLDWVTFFSTSDMGRVISYLSVTSHFESFARGVVELKDVVYYLSAIFLGLFLTARSLESLRWRA
jgi:ABC-2 type transport system permease protein